ncbi:MAG: paraquat-inducible protein A [Pseudomonadota bacterium]
MSRSRVIIQATWTLAVGFYCLAVTLPFVRIELSYDAIVEHIISEADLEPEIVDAAVRYFRNEMMFEFAADIDPREFKSTEKSSVLSGIRTLYDRGDLLLGLVVFLSVVVVPIVKFVVLFPFSVQGDKYFYLLSHMHKYAMVDVLLLSIVIFCTSNLKPLSVSGEIGSFLFLGYFILAAINFELAIRRSRNGSDVF